MNCKRTYRSRIKCVECSKVIYSDYKADHLKRKHKNNFSIKFVSVDDDPHQQKICFLPVASGATSSSVNTNVLIVSENATEKDGMECVEVTESEIPIVSACEEESEGIALTEESQASDLLKLPETTDVEECGTSQTASLLSNNADTSTEMQKEEPHQPLLRSYDRKMYQKESRDFNSQLFKKYPWTSFNIT